MLKGGKLGTNRSHRISGLKRKVYCCLERNGKEKWKEKKHDRVHNFEEVGGDRNALKGHTVIVLASVKRKKEGNAFCKTGTSTGEEEFQEREKEKKLFRGGKFEMGMSPGGSHLIDSWRKRSNWRIFHITRKLRGEEREQYF